MSSAQGRKKTLSSKAFHVMKDCRTGKRRFGASQNPSEIKQRFE